MLPKNFLESRRGRLIGFSLLYLSEGIPFGFSAIALAAYLRAQGVGLFSVSLRFFSAAAVSHSFFFGLQYGTSNAIFMRLSSRAVAATQFTAYMALHNFAYSYTSLWQGQMADLYGYARTLMLDGWLAFVPLALLPFLRAPSRPSETA